MAETLLKEVNNHTNRIISVERGEASPTSEKLILQAKAVNIKTFIILEIQREKIEKEKTKEEKCIKS